MSEGLFLTSDDDGITWTVRRNAAGVPIDLIAASDAGPFFALTDTGGNEDGTIFRSTDGQEWEQFLNPLQAAAVDATPSGIAYDQFKDELYINYSDQPYVFALMRASQISAASANAALLNAPLILVLGALPVWRKLKSLGDTTTAKGIRQLVVQKKGHP